MARQKGVLKLQGQLGDMSFYKTKDGFFVRERGGVDGERIKNDPAFARTRENGFEFGRAGAAGKLLRTALRAVLLRVGDRGVANRLTSMLMRVIQGDSTSDRGQRTVAGGDARLMRGFEFNETGKVATSFFAPYSSSIDRATGQLRLQVPAFVPREMVAPPAGATHLKLMAVGTAIDFAGGTYETQYTNSDLVDVQAGAQEAIELTVQLPPNSEHVLLLVLCLEFSQVVNGNSYALNNGAFNGVVIADVNTAV